MLFSEYGDIFLCFFRGNVYCEWGLLSGVDINKGQSEGDCPLLFRFVL